MPEGDSTIGGRFRVTLAPGELRLVQDLLNTAAVPSKRDDAPDLLDSPGTAAAWFQTLDIAAESPGLRKLQELRDAVRQALITRDHDVDGAEPAGLVIEMPVRAEFDADGAIRVKPASTGVSGLRERTILAIHDARNAGTWRRLKVCRNPDCRVAFWDKSPNTGGVWHDVRTCGNAANLRKSRARRAARAAPAPP